MAASNAASLYVETGCLEKIIGPFEQNLSLTRNGILLSNSYSSSAENVFSPSHCYVSRNERDWYIMDLQSATGTYLNGKLLKPNLPYRLQDGFIIFLGYPSTSNSAFLFRIKMQNIQKFQANCSGNGESLESPNSLSRPESMSDAQVLDHTDCSARPSFIVILNGREGNNRSNSEASIPRILAHDEENLAIIEEDNSSETKQKTDMNEPIEDPFKLPSLLARRKLLERQKELESLREAQRIKIDKYMKQLLERDFSCVICLDILIKPLQLNCSHSFCRRCIHKWKIRQNLCPICREAITAETENDSLEYFISSVAELLGEDFMKEREEALNDRKTVEESDNNERPYEELFLDVVADFGAVMSQFYEDPDDIDITESAAPYYLVISSSDSDD